MSILLKVRGIRALDYKSRKFATLSLYFLSKNSTEQLIYACLIYKIYLVKDLRANLLIRNNIISLEESIIDVKGKSALIESYKVTVSINAKQKE